MNWEEIYPTTGIGNILEVKTNFKNVEDKQKQVVTVEDAFENDTETISCNNKAPSSQVACSERSDTRETEHILHTRTNASLYVGELNLKTTEADLFELFSTIGPISFIRVCRDAVTKKSLGYAYVNFNEPADSERAMIVLNYEPLHGHNIRIMPSQRDPNTRRNMPGNLFVKNLDSSIDNRDLYKTFLNFGNILSCKIAVDEAGVSKGYGFVQFESPQAAEMAIRNVNGMVLNKKKIFVGPHIPRDLRVLESAKYQLTSIFVKNIECDTDQQFREIFKEYGNIVSALLSRDSDGVSRRFGFVSFEEPQAALNAINELNGKEVNGTILQVCRAQNRNERREELQKQRKFQREGATTNTSYYPGVNLYVKNLDFTVTDDLLRETFQRFGTITSCKVMVDKSGIPKGFGFVCFLSADDATKAVLEMNKFMLARKPLYVGLAQSREERQLYIRKHIQEKEKMRRQRMISAEAVPSESWRLPPKGWRMFEGHPKTLDDAYKSPEMRGKFFSSQAHYGNWPVVSMSNDGFPPNLIEPVEPARSGGGLRVSSLMNALTRCPSEMHTRLIGNYIYGKILGHERVKGNEHLADRVVGMLLSNQVEAVKIADNDQAFARVVNQVVASL